MALSLQVATAGCVVARLQTEQGVKEVNKSAEGQPAHTHTVKRHILLPQNSADHIGIWLLFRAMKGAPESIKHHKLTTT